MNSFPGRSLMALALFSTLSACTPDETGLTGTLEYDTVVIRSPAFESLTQINVKQGQPVIAGEVMAEVDRQRQQAILNEAIAAVDSASSNLALVASGSRNEQVLAAIAEVAQSRSQLTEAQLNLERQLSLLDQSLISASSVDQARAQRDSARAQLDQSTARRDERINGARVEEITVAQMAVRQAEARQQIEQFKLDELTIRAPVNGRVDSVPVVVGDRPRAGETLATILTGDPFVRFYLPQSERSQVAIGDALQVRIDGHDSLVDGTVRWISDTATFTPFYALNDRDRGYLTYLAEATLDTPEVLPAGFPVEVQIGE